MTQPWALSATALLSLFAKRSLSPVEALRSILARIEALEPDFNTFRLLDGERALAAAKASEARWQQGRPQGLLDGVPVAFKDLLDVRGWPTRRGSLATSAEPAQSDAPAAARVREHGAVLLGKTNTAEFGWKGLTESALAGITRNPWNREYTPTGSSGGAAAAAALGFGPLHIGTDGGGSIRGPASACGVFGLKPSHGRVPCYPPAYNGNLFHVGPIARSVGDAALLLHVISGYDARDWTSLPSDGRDARIGLEDGVRGLRIAYSRTLGHVAVEPPISATSEQALLALSELGAQTDEVDPGFSDPSPILQVLSAERAVRLFRDIPPDRHALIDPEIREAAERARAHSLSEYVIAQDRRMELAIHMRRFHERYDLLLTPVFAAPIPKVGTKPSMPFGFPFNLTQQPACSVPFGFDANGLPVGVQIVGPPHRDDLVLRAARALESARPFAWSQP